MTTTPTNVRRVGRGVPRTPPAAGRVLVHNHVRPVDFHPATPVGWGWFRAWTQPADGERLERCDCGWAPGVGVHYRVRPGATGVNC